MKPHAPPPMDAPENVWRAYMADQLAAIHLCFEGRQDATDARVEQYHTENRAAGDQLLSAMSEVKAIAQTAFSWVSAEEKQREDGALVEAGRQLERERWLRVARRLREWGGTATKYGSVIAGSTAAGYIASKFG